MKFIILFLIAIFGSEFQQNEFVIESSDSHLSIENSVMLKEFSFSSNSPAPILPISLFDKQNGTELLAAQSNPWFDITISGEQVTNLDKAWVFEDYEKRDLQNGGIELIMKFVRTEGAASGLSVSHVSQYFPGKSIFREKLVFGGKENNQLNYRDGEVYVLFSGYDLKGGDLKPVIFEEINIATWNAELLPESDYETAFDERVYEEGWREGRDLARNYMYHPQFKTHEMESKSVRGPIAIWLNEESGYGWVTAYEHGSPDQDDNQEYIEIVSKSNANNWGFNVRKQKGAFFDNESVNDNSEFETVWTMSGVFHGDNFDYGHELVWDYLLNWIIEDSYSREFLFYYNTWGWQRSAGGKGYDEREVLTEERILEEIEYASELGVELFVLDDGWQNNFGDWVPDEEKLPNGLNPIRKKLEEKDIKFGIWLALLAHDPFSMVAQENPEWIIVDDKGEPEIGNWDRQVFNFVGPYMDYFIDLNKRLIDEGVRYFKWDGMDRHLSASPHNYHGGFEQTEEERKARYGYELTRHVTKAIAILKEYQEDVVIEVDITEPYRSVGLDILSEARYFWMNNGSTWYDDYSHYRAKSTRFPFHLYGSFMPSVLMTVANYPHDDPLYRAQRYNVSSSITGGRGFWGYIEEMSGEERNRVAGYLELPKRVSETVANSRTEIVGKVGGSPEIYTTVDRDIAEGQVIGFSGTVLEYNHEVLGLDTSQLLGVVKNAFDTIDDILTIPFRFPMGNTSREAYLLTNNGSGITVQSSTSWLEDLALNGQTLTMINGAPGEHTIRWAKHNGYPSIEYDKEIDVKIDEGDEFYTLTIRTYKRNSKVIIE